MRRGRRRDDQEMATPISRTAGHPPASLKKSSLLRRASRRAMRFTRSGRCWTAMIWRFTRRSGCAGVQNHPSPSGTSCMKSECERTPASPLDPSLPRRLHRQVRSVRHQSVHPQIKHLVPRGAVVGRPGRVFLESTMLRLGGAGQFIYSMGVNANRLDA